MTDRPNLRYVTSADGIRIATYVTDRPGAEVVVLVHGYPDNHSVWDGVAGRLSERFTVVAYDVRGCGESDAPPTRDGYLIERLVDDLYAVIDAVSPHTPVHLVAHDWGSIQSWAAVVDQRRPGRVATYQSISAPSAEYAAAWIKNSRHHPRATLRQLRHSWYIGMFQIPRLPEMLFGSDALDSMMERAAAKTRGSAAVVTTPSRHLHDRINGLELYRANLRTRSEAEPRPIGTDLPVNVIVPRDDAYVTAQLASESPQPWVDDLTITPVAGGHWVISERPDVITRIVTEFIDAQTDAQSRPAQRDGTFANKLVFISGGARGIGRATAFEFARAGADLFIADIDEQAAKEVCNELRTLRVGAWSAHLDVADAAEWTELANHIKRTHGRLDIIVNNAGIGMGGPFLKTSVDDWNRILDVNVWGVIHGTRTLTPLLIEHGLGGHVVNIASAAGFTPSKQFPAYATTKAAVLMLSECLRAELAVEGIGVTAVCPGFINTDISRTTVHVGVDAETSAQMRERQIAAYQKRNYSPEKVANKSSGP